MDPSLAHESLGYLGINHENLSDDSVIKLFNLQGQGGRFALEKVMGIREAIARKQVVAPLLTTPIPNRQTIPGPQTQVTNEIQEARKAIVGLMTSAGYAENEVMDLVNTVRDEHVFWKLGDLRNRLSGAIKKFDKLGQASDEIVQVDTGDVITDSLSRKMGEVFGPKNPIVGKENMFMRISGNVKIGPKPPSVPNKAVGGIQRYNIFGLRTTGRSIVEFVTGRRVKPISTILNRGMQVEHPSSTDLRYTNPSSDAITGESTPLTTSTQPVTVQTNIPAEPAIVQQQAAGTGPIFAQSSTPLLLAAGNSPVPNIPPEIIIPPMSTQPLSATAAFGASAPPQTSGGPVTAGRPSDPNARNGKGNTFEASWNMARPMVEQIKRGLATLQPQIDLGPEGRQDKNTQKLVNTVNGLMDFVQKEILNQPQSHGLITDTTEKGILDDAKNNFNSWSVSRSTLQQQTVNADLAGQAGGAIHPINNQTYTYRALAAGYSGAVGGYGPEAIQAGKIASAQGRMEVLTGRRTNLASNLDGFETTLHEFNQALGGGKLKDAGKALEILGNTKSAWTDLLSNLKEQRTNLAKITSGFGKVAETMPEGSAKNELVAAQARSANKMMAVDKDIAAAEDKVTEIENAQKRYEGQGGRPHGGGMNADNLFGTGLSWWMAGAVAGQGEQFMNKIGQEMGKYELRKMQGLYASGVYGTGAEAIAGLNASPFGAYRTAQAQEEMANLRFGQAAYTGIAGGIRQVKTGIMNTIASSPVLSGIIPGIAEGAAQAAPLMMDALIVSQMFKGASLEGFKTGLKSFIGTGSKTVSATAGTMTNAAGEMFALPGAIGGATVAVKGTGLIGGVTSIAPIAATVAAVLGATAVVSRVADIARGTQGGQTAAELVGAGGGMLGAIGGLLGSGTWQASADAQERGRQAGIGNVQKMFGMQVTAQMPTENLTPEQRYNTEFANFYEQNASLFPTQGAEGGIQQAQMVSTALRRGAGFTPGQQQGMILSDDEKHLIAQTATQAMVSGFAQPEVYTEMVDQIRRAIAPTTTQQQWADTFGEKVQGTIAADQYNLQQMGILSQSLGFYGKVATGGKGIQPQVATNFLTNAVSQGENGMSLIRTLANAGPDMIQQAAYMMAGNTGLGAYNTSTGYTKQQESQMALTREQFALQVNQNVMKYGPGVTRQLNKIPGFENMTNILTPEYLQNPSSTQATIAQTGAAQVSPNQTQILSTQVGTGPSTVYTSSFMAPVVPAISPLQASMDQVAANQKANPNGVNIDSGWTEIGTFSSTSTSGYSDVGTAHNRPKASAYTTTDTAWQEQLANPNAIDIAPHLNKIATSTTPKYGAVQQQNEAYQYQTASMAIQRTQQVEQRKWQQEDFNNQAEQFSKRKTLINKEYELNEGLFQKRRQWQLEEFALQEQNLGKSQVRNQTQYQWQLEDISRSQSQNNIQYGWSVSDVNDEIRFATGRQRRKLVTQRQRMATQEGWQNEDYAIQRERAGIQQGWSQEDFQLAIDALKRQEAQAAETYDTQDKLNQLQKQGSDDDLTYQQTQMDNAQIRFNQQITWEDTRFKLETDHAAWLNEEQLATIAMDEAHTATMLALDAEGIKINEDEMKRGADVAKYIIDQLYSYMNEKLGIDSTGGSQGIVGTGGRALGGPVSSGVAYTVGEKGPETFVPSSNGTIVPNSGSSNYTTTTKEGLQISVTVTPTNGFEKFLGNILFVGA